MAAGPSRVSGAGMRCAPHKASPLGSGPVLLCNLSPSRTGAAHLGRRRRLQPGSQRRRRERPKRATRNRAPAGLPGPGLRSPFPLPQPRAVRPGRREQRGSPGARGTGSRPWRSPRERLCGGWGQGGPGSSPLESWSQPIPGGGFLAPATGASFLGFPL